jgi:hypothetical protein
MQSLEKLEQQKGDSHNLQIRFSLEKIGNQFLTGWVMNSAAHTASGLRHSSETQLRPTRQWHGAGDPTSRRGSVGPVSCRPTVADVQDWNHSLSLSSAYKKEKAGQSFLPHVVAPPMLR